MTLAELMAEFTPPPAGADGLASTALGAIAVTGITHDSRQVAPGFVFVALRGLHADGTAFARDAFTRGAVAVVSEAPSPSDAAVPRGARQLWMQVPEARVALASLSDVFYRHPSRELTLVGITGTNGKTTTAYLLASILDAAGLRCGRIGTVGLPHREPRVRVGPHDARGARPAADAARDGRAAAAAPA